MTAMRRCSVTVLLLTFCLAACAGTHPVAPGPIVPPAQNPTTPARAARSCRGTPSFS